MRIQYVGLKFTLIVQDGWAMGTSHTLRNCILHSMSVRLIINFEPLHVTKRVMESTCWQWRDCPTTPTNGSELNNVLLVVIGIHLEENTQVRTRMWVSDT